MKKDSHIALDLLTMLSVFIAGTFWLGAGLMMFVTHESALLLNSMVFLLLGILFQVAKRSD